MGQWVQYRPGEMRTYEPHGVWDYYEGQSHEEGGIESLYIWTEEQVGYVWQCSARKLKQDSVSLQTTDFEEAKAKALLFL